MSTNFESRTDKYECELKGRCCNCKQHKGFYIDANPLAVFTMSDVAERISLKDSETAKRWCKANGVSVYKLSKKYIVYQFDFEYALAKPFVMVLIRKHPDEWQIILQDILKWDALYNYFKLNFMENSELLFSTDINSVNAHQEKLLKRLLK